MFTQRISMDCTYEQYEKYLKDELLKMGYSVCNVDFLSYENIYENIIANNGAGNNGLAVSAPYGGREVFGRTYLGSFNAPLFLALAAMTGKAEGNYGEYVIGLKTGRFYRMREDDIILPEYKFVRKATKEEIIAKFSTPKIGKINYEVSIDTKGIITDISKALGATEVTEIDAINLLKSKGYKILKPKTWEEI